MAQPWIVRAEDNSEENCYLLCSQDFVGAGQGIPVSWSELPTTASVNVPGLFPTELNTRLLISSLLASMQNLGKQTW